MGVRDWVGIGRPVCSRRNMWQLAHMHLPRRTCRRVRLYTEGPHTPPPWGVQPSPQLASGERCCETKDGGADCGARRHLIQRWVKAWLSLSMLGGEEMVESSCAWG